ILELAAGVSAGADGLLGLPFPECGCREGTKVDESARWIAAAEGAVDTGATALDDRTGLLSWLSRAERIPRGGLVMPGCRQFGRMGDESRELTERGEVQPVY